MDRALLFPLALVAGVAAIGAAVTGAAEDTGMIDAEKARSEIFEVGPDCEWIKFRGLPEGVTGEQAVRNMELARDYYLEPRIVEGLEAGIDDPRDLAIMILEELFPQCTWPPGDLFSSHQLVYLAVAAWVTTTLEGMGRVVDDPVMPPQDSAVQQTAPPMGGTLTSTDTEPSVTLPGAAEGTTSAEVDAQYGAEPAVGSISAIGPTFRPPAPADEPFDSAFWSVPNLGVSVEEFVRTRLYEYGTAEVHLVNDDPIPDVWKPLLDWQRQYNTLSSAGLLPSYAGSVQPTGQLDPATRNAIQLVLEDQISPLEWREGLVAVAA